MTKSPPHATILLYVVELIMPLCNDSYGIFQEGDDNEEAS